MKHINTLMVQGTGSNTGKSMLVTGLCRLLYRHGVSVAPFKPQNMALNSAVTVEDGEIGRAQAVQAQAAGVEASVHMNPVLLKPNTDIGAQIIVQGNVMHDMDAAHYHRYKTTAMEAVLDSYKTLQSGYEFIVVEGAGSPAEINLRDQDIANMGFAEAVDCPVMLIADIDFGGVFAQIIGTLELLSPSERKRVLGFVINKFRGDVALLEPGLEWLHQRTGIPVIGVLPYLHNFYLEAEDALPTNSTNQHKRAKLQVVVPALSRISNHNDFDALRLHPQIDLKFIGPNQPVPNADLICLPGSKNVRSDLQWLRKHGWEIAINRHLRYGGKLIGICGGFQMLGKQIADPNGIEGKSGSSSGLGFFDMNTILMPAKQLKRVQGVLSIDSAPVEGYEIHAGKTTGPALKNPALFLEDRAEGAISRDNQIMGTYLHGLFDTPQACNAILRWCGVDDPEFFDIRTHREREIDRLADVLDANLNLNQLPLGQYFN